MKQTMSLLLKFLLLVIVTTPPALAEEKDDNYIMQSSTFASLSSVQKLLLPEVEVMAYLEKVKSDIDRTSQMLDQYIENYKKINLLATFESPEEAYEIYKQKREELEDADGLDWDVFGKAIEDMATPSSNVTTSSLSSGNETESTQVDKELTTPAKLKAASRPTMLEVIKTSAGEVPYGAGVKHPIDSYLLLKRLSLDWGYVNETLTELTANTTSLLKGLELLRNHFQFPTEADLQGAAVSLVRLQSFHRLDMDKFGAGTIEKKHTASDRDLQSVGRLRPWDYILVGQQAYQQGLLDQSMRWFGKAVELSESGDYELNEEEQEIIPQLTNVVKTHTSLEISNIDEEQLEKPAILKNDLSDDDNTVNQNWLCSGKDIIMTDEDRSKLHCSYQKVSAYFQIMPLKIEVVHDLPRIFLIHDFVLKSQTDAMIKRSRPHLSPSTIVSDGELVNSMIRISMTSWLDDDGPPSDVMTKVSKKIGATVNMNAFSAGTSEIYQVVNYGIGGHYRYHNDFNPKDRNTAGKRLLTFTVYLKDVSGGGETVFTKLGVRVRPQRGTALVWYNLFRSGEPDYSTTHASCPVLHGDKWITTKWVRFNGQFARHPCSLDEEERFTFP